MPGIGTAGGFGGKRTRHRDVLHLLVASPRRRAIYRYDIGTGEEHGLRQPKVKFDPADYETKQVFYPSKDGTKVPMFLTHKKGLKLDGKNPTLLYGYGGFNISLTPGVLASPRSRGWRWAASTRVANLRGGGEYGEDWHKAGTKLAEAERLRRLHRRGRVADSREVHVAAEAGDPGRQQRRPAGRRLHDAAARPVRRVRCRRRRAWTCCASTSSRSAGRGVRLRRPGRRRTSSRRS